MEKKYKKCSSDKHDQNASSFCPSCKIYMCNKCISLHSELFRKHEINNLTKEANQIFSGICKEDRHQNELEYFCKNHNILCCAACISKIQSKGNGYHNNCDVCNIEDIKIEKKNLFKKNIVYLEDISNKIENSIIELKSIFEKINKNKEHLKLKIIKAFTELRNLLNEREDNLILEVDKEFNNIYFNEDIIKQSEKLPKQIKYSLEKGKLIENKWDDNNNLNSLKFIYILFVT